MTDVLRNDNATCLPLDDRQRFASWCLFALLFLVCVGLQPLRGAGSDIAATTGEGDIVRQSGYAVVFLVTIWVTWRTGWVKTVPLLVLLLFGWCWISFLWAIEPGIALRRLLLMTFIAAVLFATVEALGTTMAIRTVVRALLVALAVNYIAVVLTPLAVHQPGESSDLALIGNWRGVTNHKNFAGAVSAITVLMLIFGPRVLRRSFNWAALGAAAYFLYRTQSKTSMAVLVVSVAIGALYLAATPRGKRLIVPSISMVVGLFLVAFGSQILADLSRYLSQPDALTGRAEIWTALVEYARQNPWLGAGYGSFWDVGRSSPIYGVAGSWVEDLNSGHNGYLDILVQTGWPGALLAVSGLVVVPLWQATKSGDRSPTSGALIISIVVFCACHNMSESGFLARDFITSVAILFTAALSKKLVAERKIQKSQ